MEVFETDIVKIFQPNNQGDQKYRDLLRVDNC